MVALSLVLGVAIFLSFYRFFSGALPEYAVNIAAAFLGAVITIIVTAVLLQAQSSAELNKEKSLGVFNAKVAMYTDFLDFLNRITADGEIDDEELREFRAWAFRLSLVAGSIATNTINLFVAQVMVARQCSLDRLSDDSRIAWQEWFEETYPGIEEHEWYTIGDIVMSLRYDLQVDESSDDEELQASRDMIEDMLEAI